MPARLGQNFLINRAVVRRIVDAFLPIGGPVLEIGPGRGILTEPLLAAAAGQRLVAVELDPLLAAKLRERLGAAVEIVDADIRRIDLGALFADGEISVIGNIPYFISKEIVDWLLAGRRRIARGQILVQREFALKLLAAPGSRLYNPQSVMFQRLFAARKLFAVAPGSFAPAPRVVSELLAFTSRRLTANDDQPFYRFLKHAFAGRRKTLANNLHGLYPAPAVQAALAGSETAAAARAEELPGEQLHRVFLRLGG